MGVMSGITSLGCGLGKGLDGWLIARLRAQIGGMEEGAAD